MIRLYKTVVEILAGVVYGEWLLAIRRCEGQEEYGYRESCELCKLVPDAHGGFERKTCSICICYKYIVIVHGWGGCYDVPCELGIQLANDRDPFIDVTWSDSRAIKIGLKELQSFVMHKSIERFG